MMWAALPDMHHTIEHQFADDDWVATCVTVRGTHRGTFMGVAPTGKEISFIVLMMNRVEDGTIVLHYGIPDFMAILQPLGLIPVWAA
jgi:predicted ester cyclase